MSKKCVLTFCFAIQTSRNSFKIGYHSLLVRNKLLKIERADTDIKVKIYDECFGMFQGFCFGRG